jgi:hypothetical protein
VEGRGQGQGHLKAVHVLQEQVGRWSVEPRQKSQQVGEAPGSGVVGSRLLPVTRIRLPCPDSHAGGQHPPPHVSLHDPTHPA